MNGCEEMATFYFLFHDLIKPLSYELLASVSPLTLYLSRMAFILLKYALG